MIANIACTSLISTKNEQTSRVSRVILSLQFNWAEILGAEAGLDGISPRA